MIGVAIAVFVILTYWIIVAFRRAKFSAPRTRTRSPAASRQRSPPLKSLDELRSIPMVPVPSDSPATIGTSPWDSPSSKSSAPPKSAVVSEDDGDGENQIFDDLFFKYCSWSLPLCFAGIDRDDIFRERSKSELRSRKLELHLDGKVVVNEPIDYWGDTFYYIFQKDHFLSIFYCDHDHAFTKRERLKVYWAMCATAAFCATAFLPPSDCVGYVDPEADDYGEMHTWGRIDCGWTYICNSGMSPPHAQQAAVITAAVLKVTYGMFLEYIAFCPCFVDFVGAFKDRTEKVGAYVLNFACLLAIYQIYYASRVIMHSPFKVDMCVAIANTIIAGIFTGWITYFGMAHCTRIKEVGIKTSCVQCAQGADADGDGVECMEVLSACKHAWNEQKDTSWKEHQDAPKATAAKSTPATSSAAVPMSQNDGEGGSPSGAPWSSSSNTLASAGDGSVL
jgi:hypothetical protein